MKNSVSWSTVLHAPTSNMNIRTLVERGSYFFDYGNAFMKAVFVAETRRSPKTAWILRGLHLPSYVEDNPGPELFDYGYGPFRWCCLSGKHEDLIKTDHAAMEIIDPNRRFQDPGQLGSGSVMLKGTSWWWGPSAGILYQDALGRRDIALKFNEMVRNGEIGPVMLGPRPPRYRRNGFPVPRDLQYL